MHGQTPFRPSLMWTGSVLNNLLSKVNKHMAIFSKWFCCSLVVVDNSVVACIYVKEVLLTKLRSAQNPYPVLDYIQVAANQMELVNGSPTSVLMVRLLAANLKCGSAWPPPENAWTSYHSWGIWNTSLWLYSKLCFFIARAACPMWSRDLDTGIWR